MTSIRRNPSRNTLAVWLLLLASLVMVAALANSGIGQGAAVLMLWLLPTVAWARILHGSFAARITTAAGLALLFNAFVALFWSYVPGRITPFALGASACVVVLFPLWWQSVPLKWQVWQPRVDYLLVAGVAALLRFSSIGYKEIQGDEGIILYRAAATLMGDTSELLLHQKGPLEILIPIAQWGLTGEISDFWLRVPFAWAGILSVLAVMLLAQRWCGSSIALISGLLYSICGFGIAFSHIIQYQNLVILFGALALLQADDYRQVGERRNLIFCGLFFAAGLLAHYDTVLVAPAIGWVLFRETPRERRFYRNHWLPALAVGLGAAAAFYVPFVLNPTFGRTLSYLLNDRVGTGSSLFTWGFPTVWRMVTFYNSTYYIVGLAFLLGLGLYYMIRNGLNIPALLYWAVPAVFYLLIVSTPRTHVYTIFPGLTILSALGLYQGWQLLTPKVDFDNGEAVSGGGGRAKTVAAAAFIAWFFVSSVYVYLIFIDTTPERQRTWVFNQPRFFPTTWDEPPDFGLFGFPYQSGWRAAAELIEPPYASNEEEEITNWDTAQAQRTHCPNINTFLMAENVQDEIAWHPDILNDLHLNAIVTINESEKLRVYKREPATYIPTIEAASWQRWLRPDQVAPSQYSGDYPLNVMLDEKVSLLGYDLDMSNAVAGGSIAVTLYWQAHAAFDENFQTFVHVLNGDTLLAQHDGAPECGINPTTRWEPGQIVPDTHIVQLDSDTPLSESLTINTGMYSLIGTQPLINPDNGTKYIPLTDITIAP